MEVVIFWAIINAIVGAVIGSRKNAVGICIVVSILLGPIGWIIGLVMEGNPRKCPFCAEAIKDQAILCPHCHRDLPKPEPPRPFVESPRVLPPAEAKGNTRNTAIVFGIIVLLVGAIIAAVVSKKNGAGEPNREQFSSSFFGESPTPSPPPEFVRLTDYFALVNAKGKEIKTLEPGKRLRVVTRSRDQITVDYLGEHFTLPANVTEPSK